MVGRGNRLLEPSRPVARCSHASAPLLHGRLSVSGAFGGQEGSWLLGTVDGDDEPTRPATALERRTCLICHKVFRHRESLCNHMEMHRGFTTCPRCGKVLSTKKSLRLHLNRRCGAAAAAPRGDGTDAPPPPAAVSQGDLSLATAQLAGDGGLHSLG